MEDTVLIQKMKPGRCRGYEWEEAGAVIAVPKPDAAIILRIPDAGFREVVRDDQGAVHTTGEMAEIMAAAERRRQREQEEQATAEAEAEAEASPSAAADLAASLVASSPTVTRSKKPSA